MWNYIDQIYSFSKERNCWILKKLHLQLNTARSQKNKIKKNLKLPVDYIFKNISPLLLTCKMLNITRAFP